MFSRVPEYTPLLVNQSTPVTTPGRLVNDYRHVMLAVASTGNAEFTLTVLGSLQRSPLGETGKFGSLSVAPNFSAPASPQNHYDAVSLYDLSNPSALLQAVVATDDINKNFVINSDGFYWLAFDLQITQGQVTAWLVMYNNQ